MIRQINAVIFYVNKFQARLNMNRNIGMSVKKHIFKIYIIYC